MACPKCGEKKQQQDYGEIKQKRPASKLPPVILYRCGKCSFLYTVPPLDEPEQQASGPADEQIAVQGKSKNAKR